MESPMSNVKLNRIWFIMILSFALHFEYVRSNLLIVPNEYSSIQTAIDNVANNDTILVEPGIYYENLNCEFVHKNIKIFSRFELTQDTSFISQTIIHGNQNKSVITITNPNDSTSIHFCGFTITGGKSEYGGGICIHSSYAHLEHLNINNNQSQLYGGGIYVESANNYTEVIINDLIVENNIAPEGGGIVLMEWVNAILKDIIINDNHATQRGGGLLLSVEGVMGNMKSNFENVEIKNNTANEGAGVYCGGYKTAVFKNMIIHSNIASIMGGGLYMVNSNLENCTIVNNDASKGCGIYCGHGTNQIKNTIIWNNSKEEVNFTQSFNTDTLYILYSNIQNGLEGIIHDVESTIQLGDEIMAMYPEFVDSSNNDYRLSNHSLAVDAGDPDSEYSNEPPYNGRRVNLGAYGNTNNATASSPQFTYKSDYLINDALHIEEFDSSVIIISNTGTTRLNIDSIFLTDSINFQLVSPSINYLLPNDSRTIHIAFNPTYSGEFNTYLHIKNNDELNGNIRIPIYADYYDITIAPQILSIDDIPNDQGGWIKIEFIKSIFDTNSLVLSKIASPEIYSIEYKDNSSWISATSVIAYGKTKYSVLVHTIKDSTKNDIGLIDFRIIAGMTEGNYVSDVKSGYSVDNLAPSIPQRLSSTYINETTTKIMWNSNLEADFNYYNIYKSDDNYSFTKHAETIDTIFIDTSIGGGSNYYYKITAVDFSGNESQYSNVISVDNNTKIDKQKSILEFCLFQNYPNPFNPLTIINYSVKNSCKVNLNIYNLNGQNMMTLVNSYQQAGNYSIQFDASNLSSGIYIYKIQMESYTDIKKMIKIE